MSEIPTIVQLRITLLGIAPPIWRKLLVPQSMTLADLHHIIQAAFGWLDYHLHEFEIGGLRFGDPDLMEDALEGDSSILPETDVRLCDFVRGAQPFVYVYDFGDNWRHAVEIEGRALPAPGRKYPACVGESDHAHPRMSAVSAATGNSSRSFTMGLILNTVRIANGQDGRSPPRHSTSKKRIEQSDQLFVPLAAGRRPRGSVRRSPRSMDGGTPGGSV